jgi:hypothetical protein
VCLIEVHDFEQIVAAARRMFTHEHATYLTAEFWPTP